MSDSRSDGRDKIVLPPGGEMLCIEQTLGAIVVEMIREGRIITRQSLCVAVAGRIDQTTPAVLEAHYADILRLLLTQKLGE
ncbi:hypothetical protein KXR87_17175 [Yokenella regensburgei]|uniref:hypothetical protein n=1 Tax=Yokenella regensburgei TaxID=158877 RepID=UPI003F178238